MKNKTTPYLFFIILLTLPVCSFGRDAKTTVIMPAYKFMGQYNSASVGVFGAQDGTLKLEKNEIKNIGDRIYAKLKFYMLFSQLKKYDPRAKDVDLYIVVNVQDVQVVNTTEKAYAPGFLLTGIPIGTRATVTTLILVRLFDGKTSGEIGAFNCQWSTDPLQIYENDILSSDEMDYLADAISEYLHTLV